MRLDVSSENLGKNACRVRYGKKQLALVAQKVACESRGAVALAGQRHFVVNTRRDAQAREDVPLKFPLACASRLVLFVIVWQNLEITTWTIHDCHCVAKMRNFKTGASDFKSTCPTSQKYLQQQPVISTTGEQGRIGPGDWPRLHSYGL